MSTTVTCPICGTKGTLRTLCAKCHWFLSDTPWVFSLAPVSNKVLRKLPSPAAHYRKSWQEFQAIEEENDVLVSRILRLEEKLAAVGQAPESVPEAQPSLEEAVAALQEKFLADVKALNPSDETLALMTNILDNMMKKASDEAQQAPAAPAFDPISDFTIENGVLKGYLGSKTDIRIPDCVTTLGFSCFAMYCNVPLKRVVIPSSVTTIEGMAFSGCTALEHIEIPDSVTTIKSYGFAGCASLKQIRLPAKLTAIAGYTFSGCEALESITIPNSVTSIGIEAFYACKALADLTIPANVTQIEDRAFCECDKLIQSQGLHLPPKFNTPVQIARIAGLPLPSDGDPTEDFRISGYALEEYVGNRRVVRLPSWITSIEREAFAHCGKISEILIPDGVKEIDKYAFYQCRSLERLTIPNSVTSIGDGALLGCDALLRMNGLRLPPRFSTRSELARLFNHTPNPMDQPL